MVYWMASYLEQSINSESLSASVWSFWGGMVHSFKKDSGKSLELEEQSIACHQLSFWKENGPLPHFLHYELNWINYLFKCAWRTWNLTILILLYWAEF